MYSHCTGHVFNVFPSKAVTYYELLSKHNYKYSKNIVEYAFLRLIYVTRTKYHFLVRHDIKSKRQYKKWMK